MQPVPNLTFNFRSIVKINMTIYRLTLDKERNDVFVTQAANYSDSEVPYMKVSI